MARYALMIPGFGPAILGAESLIRGASALTKRRNVSNLVIGLTVMAFGTSLPEPSVNAVASIKSIIGIASGKVLGNNIANVLLIPATYGVIWPLTTAKGTVWEEIPFGLLDVPIAGILAKDRFVGGCARRAWVILIGNMVAVAGEFAL
jgi:cation:H+ antiporter